MRIGVNLLFMAPGEVGGSEPLLTNLVRAMAESDHHLTVFALNGFSAHYPDIAERVSVTEVPWSRSKQGLRVGAENSWLPLALKRRRLDVIHHGVGTTPFVKALPSVVTIHDIQYRHFPRNFVKAKRAWLSINVPWSVRSSEVVTVPSEWVAKDVAGAFRLDPSKIVVVPFGGTGLLPEDSLSEDDIRRTMRLDRPFFLYPSRTYPHKNHHFLVEAFAPLAEHADLVLTGPPWFRDRALQDVSRRLGLSGKVRHLGMVTRAELGGLYRAATALVYPTRFEGFGAPVLEAMSMGCPVIASNATSVPEVAGDSAILLDPGDVSGWTEMMNKVLEDGSLRALLAEKGRARAAEFSWARSASLQLKAYEQAIAAPRSRRGSRG